ncbi:unnamed protein product, partial [Rotaria sordida]
QPTTNDQYDNSNYYSTTIHSIEPSEQISSQPHYIQETTSDNQHPTSSYHIEPVNTSHHDDDKNEQNTNQIPFRQSTNINNESNFDIQTNLNDQSNELN